MTTDFPLPAQQITIHLLRLNKPGRKFDEGLVEDNGVRLITFSAIPTEISTRLSKKFRLQGWLQPEQRIAFVAKYLFYQEYFSI